MSYTYTREVTMTMTEPAVVTLHQALDSSLRQGNQLRRLRGGIDVGRLINIKIP